MGADLDDVAIGERPQSRYTSRMLPIHDGLAIPDDELEVSFARSSGAGGQNVNKVNSKAQLRFAVARSPSLPDGVRQRFLSRYQSRITTEGEILLTCDRHRDQAKNLEECRERLRQLILAVLFPPKPRRPTRRTRGSVERRLRAKAQQGARKRERGRSGFDD